MGYGTREYDITAKNDSKGNLMKKPSSLTLARLAGKIAEDKKGIDPVILNVRLLSSVTDYFIIVTAGSAPQMNAILDTIEDEFREKYDIRPSHREGAAKAKWVVLDYGNLIVHVLTPEARELFSLEKIWPDAKKSKKTKK